MRSHLRANLWLLGLTVLICCVLYPLVLFGVGLVFPYQAQGSLVDENGNATTDPAKAKGSLLIGQNFEKPGFFKPRPSATTPAYNAAASGASNWGANNYQLRDRVARSLGPIVKYGSGPKKGELVADDIVKWFREDKPGVVAEWAEAHSGLAQAWVKDNAANTKYVEEWAKDHPAEVDEWKTKNPKTPEPKAEDLAVVFFQSFAKKHPGEWLTAVADKDVQGNPVKDAADNPVKHVERVPKDAEDSADIAAVFFDSWRQAHPDVDLEPVPADLVMASASGLDPHITLANALYQVPFVARERAQLLVEDRTIKKSQQAAVEKKLHDELEKLVQERSGAPLFGLAGVPLVNVLEINLAVPSRVTEAVKTMR